MSMRGPIIQEHVTDGELQSASVAESLTYNVKSDGRALRVYVKLAVDTGGSITTTVKPVAHFSTGKSAFDWPLITDSKGEVFPNTGTVTQTTTGDYEFAIFVSKTFCASEYEIKIATNVAAQISAVYVVTELV